MAHSRVTTTEQRLDPSTQRFLQEFRGQQQGLFQGRQRLPAGFEQLQGVSRGLLGQFDIAQQTGLTGIERFLDPELENVIGGLRPEFQRQRELASNLAGAQATRASAFGGSRQAVLESIGLGDINRAETQQIGQLRQQAFGSAARRLLGERQRAGQLGQQGFQNLFGIGQFQDARQLAALQAGVPGFQTGGRTTTETTPQEHGSVLGSILGVAAPIGGAVLGGLVGGPAGATAGFSAGSALGRTGLSDFTNVGDPGFDPRHF